MLTLENRTKTVAALRSGEFKQARGRLQNYKGDLCCIGVAYNACVGQIPKGVDTFNAAHAVGFSYDEQSILINMNDVTINSFSEIADVIETFPVAEATGAAA